MPGGGSHLEESIRKKWLTLDRKRHYDKRDDGIFIARITTDVETTETTSVDAQKKGKMHTRADHNVEDGLWGRADGHGKKVTCQFNLGEIGK